MLAKTFITKVRAGNATAEEVSDAVKILTEHTTMDDEKAKSLIEAIRSEQNTEDDVVALAMAMDRASSEGETDEEKTEEDVSASSETNTSDEVKSEEEQPQEQPQEQNPQAAEKKLAEAVGAGVQRTKVPTPSFDEFGKNLRRSRKDQIVVHSVGRAEMTSEQIHDHTMKELQRLRSGGKDDVFGVADPEAFSKLVRMRNEIAETEGIDGLKKFSLTRAVNTLSTAGSGNATLNNSIATAIAAFSFTDQASQYGLATEVPTTAVDSNSYKGQIVTESAFVRRTQGNDVPGSQGTVANFSVTLLEYSSIVPMDYTVLMAAGDPLGAFQTALSRGWSKHKSSQILASITGASGSIPSGVATFGLGSGNALQNLSRAAFEEDVGSIKGAQSEKRWVLSQAGRGVVRGINNSSSDQRAVFTEYPYNRDVELLGGLQTVMDDNLGTLADAKNSSAARKVGIIGNLSRGVIFCANPSQQVTGVQYVHRSNQLEAYWHGLTGAGLYERNMLGVQVTNTA